MRRKEKIAVLCVGMLLATLASAQGQSQAGTGASHLVMLSSAAPADSEGSGVRISSSGIDRGQIVREIDDPSSGARWLLVKDAAHPGGPGRLVLVAEGGTPPLAGQTSVLQSADQPLNRAAIELPPSAQPPVVRAGDRLTVEEITPVVESHLEAVALAPAVAGGLLDARLKVGGQVVRVVALGSGRARLAPPAEGRR
jgi:hypothetical protein